jgi:hypothetical protein
MRGFVATMSDADMLEMAMSDLVRTLDEGDIDAVAAYLNAAQ